MEIEFNEDLETGDLAIAVERLETSIRKQHAEVKNIFIEAKSISASCKVLDVS